MSAQNLRPANLGQVGRPDEAARGLVILEKFIDAIVPRGGKSLIERISQQARVPVIKHLDGVCHVFIDASANPEMAIRIADNAKTQRYSTCNTMETLLVAGRKPRHGRPPTAQLAGAAAALPGKG